MLQPGGGQPGGGQPGTTLLQPGGGQGGGQLPGQGGMMMPMTENTAAAMQPGQQVLSNRYVAPPPMSTPALPGAALPGYALGVQMEKNLEAEYNNGYMDGIMAVARMHGATFSVNGIPGVTPGMEGMSPPGAGFPGSPQSFASPGHGAGCGGGPPQQQSFAPPGQSMDYGHSPQGFNPSAYPGQQGSPGHGEAPMGPDGFPMSPAGPVDAHGAGHADAGAGHGGAAHGATSPSGGFKWPWSSSPTSGHGDGHGAGDAHPAVAYGGHDDATKAKITTKKKGICC
jgi:hypothetical protein